MAADRADPELILVVDDDPEIGALISAFLAQHGFKVEVARDAEEMERRIALAPPDLIVLDLMLPGEDGLAICRRLAAAGGPPVIMLSALGEETDRIVGLEVGADDYLPKPCSPRELLARIRAVLRRRRELPATAPAAGKIYRFGDWSFDLIRRELRSKEGVAVPLSAGEFQLLRVFVERPLRVLTRDQLLELARGIDSDVYDRAIDVQVSRLRKKLSSGPDGDFIQTIRNEGYMFSVRPSLG